MPIESRARGLLLASSGRSCVVVTRRFYTKQKDAGNTSLAFVMLGAPEWARSESHPPTALERLQDQAVQAARARLASYRSTPASRSPLTPWLSNSLRCSS